MFNKALFITLIIFSQSIYGQSEDSLMINKKNPWGAVIRSAIVPGLGQVYNHSYWKIPIIWGVIGWCGYNWNFNNNNYKNYKDLFLKSVSDGKPNYYYKQLREFYRDQRDLFAVYLGLTYLLNLVDAYVDAHLFNFDLIIRDDEIQFNMKINLR